MFNVEAGDGEGRRKKKEKKNCITQEDLRFGLCFLFFVFFFGEG